MSTKEDGIFDDRTFSKKYQIKIIIFAIIRVIEELKRIINMYHQLI